MKKIITASFFLLVTGMIHAQKPDLNLIKNTIIIGQYEKAKPDLDAFLAIEKNAKNAEAWYYKGFLYAAMGTNDKYAAYCNAACRNTSLDAFTKYLSLDSKAPLLQEEGNVSLAVLYGNAFDKGLKEYNAKNYGAAIKEFELALQAEEFMWNNKLIYAPKDQPAFPTVAMDTGLILNIAVSAELSNDVDNALKYYQKLADANITGKQNQIIYEYLADNYHKKGNRDAFQAIITKAMTLYPNADYFLGLEVNAIPKDAPKTEVYAKYDELSAKYPGKYFIEYNYAVDLFKYIYTGENTQPDRAALKDKLTKQIQKAIAVDKGAESNVLMVLHLSESGYEIKDGIAKIKGQTPADQKKRNALKDEGNKMLYSSEPYADAAIAWFASQTELKIAQKSNFKKMYELKREIAKMKNDQKKVVELEKKIAEIKM